MYVRVCLHIHICRNIYMYIEICLERGRERQRGIDVCIYIFVCLAMCVCTARDYVFIGYINKRISM